MAKPLQFKCTSCGQVISIPAPQAPGLYQVICPHCGHVLKIKYAPKPIQMAPVATPIQTPMPTPQASPKKDDAIEQARHAPTQRFGSLGEMMGASASGSAAPRYGASTGNGKIPKLSMVRLGMDKQYFPLKQGDNIVGRKDPLNPIDVEIDGDATMSRRSVCIRVERRGATNAYSLTVLKAANPVMVNNSSVPVGQMVTLTVGSSICLGQTVLRLEES